MTESYDRCYDTSLPEGNCDEYIYSLCEIEQIDSTVRNM